MLKPIKEILMERDNMSLSDAEALIDEARQEAKRRFDEEEMFNLLDLDSEICSEYFGLEPDYFWEISPY